MSEIGLFEAMYSARALRRLKPDPVPEEIITRMRKANEKSKEHAVAEGIAIAREMFERVKPVVQGVQVSAPFGKVELALQVFEGVL